MFCLERGNAGGGTSHQPSERDHTVVVPPLYYHTVVFCENRQLLPLIERFQIFNRLLIGNNQVCYHPAGCKAMFGC